MTDMTNPGRAFQCGRALGAACALLTVACSGPKPSKHAPASVANPVGEGALTTVTLTPDAVRRLGIVTVAVDSAVVAPARTVGGEVLVPPGLALTVSAPIAGTVLAPPDGAMPRAGGTVRAGQPLLRLLALPADPARAEEDLATVEARYRQVQLEAERVSQLAADGLVSTRDLQRAEADLAAAHAALAAARGRRALVGGVAPAETTGLAALVVRAPATGVLAQLSAGPGQTVAAGAPLAQVMPLDRLWVRVPVFAGEAAELRRGGEATVSALSGTASAPRGLRAVSVPGPPSADPLASTVDLFFELRGALGQLQPGERVAVTLALSGTGARALVAPAAAIVHDIGGGAWVYERTDSVTFVRRRVAVREVADGRAVLAQGPRVGALVVTDGAAELFGTEFGPGK
jgi:membrane fusion protein, heavy metal efflux system